MRLLPALFAAALFLAPAASFAQTGKIVGTVTDVATGEPLIGVNVTIDGTTQGAATNVDGYYAILNIAPGTYSVRASMIGFSPQLQEGVRVNIDLTTEVNFALGEERMGFDELVVTAQQPIVHRDVSANVANISIEDVENLPVMSVSEVVGLQAGTEGLSVRGSGAEELAFMVDGISMRNARDNTPMVSMSLTSIEEVQVQTGGFNAEYGNVRSGVVNVTTREGDTDRYTADIIARYSPPSRKHFGIPINDPNAFWMRPYLDPDVAFVGTHSDESPWDQWTRDQFPEFEGFNQRSATSIADPDMPDLTPQQAQEVWLWERRKDFSPTVPDVNIDGSIGGPIPVISKALGNLRFFSSYQQTTEAYVVPLRLDSYEDRSGQIKLTSDLARGMKLNVNGLYSVQTGHATSSVGGPGMYRSVDGMASSLTHNEYDWYLWEDDGHSLSEVIRTQIGVRLTHALSSRTFYDVRLSRNSSSYETGPQHIRDSTTVYKVVGEMELGEAPLGYWHRQGRATGRDSSEVALYTLSGSATSQVNQFIQLKVGADIYYTDYNSNHGSFNPGQLSVSNPWFVWNRQSAQGAAYSQAKLEFQGMVANVGLRLDYFDPMGEWYVYDTFERAFSSNALEELDQQSTKSQLSLSPRLGVSFPVTDNSKLYFNYGHFRNTQQMPEMFMTRTVFQETAIDRVGNPNLPMTKTIAYELGYDQNLFDTFLLRVAGYYKASSDQPRDVYFESIDSRVRYYTPLPFNYGDTRGIEFTLQKNRGKWIRGFANYTYMVRKTANFGFNEIYENPARMREAIRVSQQHYPSRPVPEPYANFNIEFLTPNGFGPEVAGVHPVGDWRLSFLGRWRAGETFTYTGGASGVRLVNNVKWSDSYMLDMRLSKNFSMGSSRAQFFIDVSNVLNLKRMNRGSAFVGLFDFENYMESLRLPADTYEGQDPYRFIPGDDRPGDYRNWDVEYVPIVVVDNIDDMQGHARPLYYEEETGRYMTWDGEGWGEADKSLVNQVIEDKAYIDMPNSRYFAFLNPRNIAFGMRISL